MTDPSKLGNSHTIMAVDDDADLLDKVRLMLHASGFTTVETLTDSTAVLPTLAERPASVLIMDWVMPNLSGTELLPCVLNTYPDMPVIVLTAVNDVQTAVECMRNGAFDFITKPVDPNRLRSSIGKALQIRELSLQNKTLKEYMLEDQPARPEIFSDIVTVSHKMEAIFKYIEALSSSRNPVLITGESGVGKELLARAIHKASGLEGDFVALNVAGLDDDMFADTLFGHRKGAFTGANEARHGLLKKAENGTIFLDEIGDLSMESQIKLLRLLQEKEYYRLGSDALIKSNARIIAATNRTFKALIADGTFRHDLYHRLSSHEFSVPPLRDRREDIPVLLRHFVAESASTLKKQVPVISTQVVETLMHYRFPGNARELKNKVFNAVTINSSGTLSIEDFPGIPAKPKTELPQSTGTDKPFSLISADFPTLEAIEQHAITEAMRYAKGNKSLAAELLGISRMTLLRKLGNQ